jgi:hypothetical protein
VVFPALTDGSAMVQSRSQPQPQLQSQENPQWHRQTWSEHFMGDQLASTTAVFTHAGLTQHMTPGSMPESPDRLVHALHAIKRLMLWRIGAAAVAMVAGGGGGGGGSSSSSSSSSGSTGSVAGREEHRKLELVVYQPPAPSGGANGAKVRPQVAHAAQPLPHLAPLDVSHLLLVHAPGYMKRVRAACSACARTAPFVAGGNGKHAAGRPKFIALSHSRRLEKPKTADAILCEGDSSDEEGWEQRPSKQEGQSSGEDCCEVDDDHGILEFRSNEEAAASKAGAQEEGGTRKRRLSSGPPLQPKRNRSCAVGDEGGLDSLIAQTLTVNTNAKGGSKRAKELFVLIKGVATTEAGVHCQLVCNSIDQCLAVFEAKNGGKHKRILVDLQRRLSTTSPAGKHQQVNVGVSAQQDNAMSCADGITWQYDGHGWIGRKLRRIFGSTFADAVVTAWVPAEGGDQALFHVVRLFYHHDTIAATTAAHHRCREPLPQPPPHCL